MKVACAVSKAIDGWFLRDSMMQVCVVDVSVKQLHSRECQELSEVRDAVRSRHGRNVEAHNRKLKVSVRRVFLMPIYI